MTTGGRVDVHSKYGNDTVLKDYLNHYDFTGNVGAGFPYKSRVELLANWILRHYLVMKWPWYRRPLLEVKMRTL